METNAPLKKEIKEELGSLCYEYFFNDDKEKYCRFYINTMSKYSSFFSKIFFKQLRKKGYNNRTFFAYLDDFHPNGRGQEALNRSRNGFGSKILNKILKDCNDKNVKIIFVLASTESAKKFFIRKQGWIQAYPKKRNVCYKEM